jgi:hypothetical protein
VERELDAFGAFGILGVLVLEQMLLIDAQVLLFLLVFLPFIVRQLRFDTRLIILTD